MATQGRHADLVERLRAIASRFDMTSTERYEQDSEAFYAATGYMAPGKDVPMAMGWQNETERRAAHEAWIASRNRSQQQAIQEAADALAALPPPANPLYEYCPSCRRLGPLLGLTAIRSEETGGRHCISCFGKTESRLLPLWTAPPPADPPAIVALVREWQRKQRGCDIENTAAAYAELDIAEAELLAYPLPAAPPVPETPQGRKDCVIGVYCQRHGWVHGQEAEELRERLEELGNKAVNRVLDEVDARDSLAYLEATNEPTPPSAPAVPPQEDQ